MAQKQLPPREWIVVVSLIVFLIVLTLLVQYNDANDEELNHSSAASRTEVQMAQSDVANPAGITYSNGGMAEGELSANQKIVKNARMKKKQSEYITIYLQGAVKVKGALQVPKGTTYQTLLKLVEFNSDADISFLKSNRKKLKNEQVIEIESLTKNSSTVSLQPTQLPEESLLK